MAYGDNITEKIPVTLSNPVNNQTYQGTGVAYDIAIGGQPFFLETSDDSPYRRVTAQYRKQQLDTTKEPGEQTLTGWWLRSQSSFHLGQGVKFYEPSQDELLRFQYNYSKGCNIWDKGQVTLLKDSLATHYSTGKIPTTGSSKDRPVQILRSITWVKNSNTYQGCLFWDEYDVDKVFDPITVSITNKALTSNVATFTTSANHGLCVGMVITITGVDATFNGSFRITGVPTSTTFTYAKTASNVTSTAVSPAGTGLADVIHFIDYNAGTDAPVKAICDDGVYAYWVTNNTGSGKLEVLKKLLTDDSTVAGTSMFTSPSIVAGNCTIEYIKERLVMTVNNVVYEFATSATSLPTATYTHPTADYVYTSIAASGAAIYLSGFSGIQSTIQKFTLVTTSGAMPTLSSAITAAELPAGETSLCLFYYLDYMCIGTSKGVRIAAINSTDGSLAYGPLIFESEQPVYDFAAYDKYIWCASNVDGAPGTTRIDLGSQIGTNLVFAYAWDVYYPSVSGHPTTSCAFMGTTNRLMYCTAATDAGNGGVYAEYANQLVSTGELRTGFVRYSTLENKIFKYILPRFDTTNGGIDIASIEANDDEYNIGSYPQGSEITEVGIAYPPGAQQYLGFKFTFTRNQNDNTSGPTFTGYQLKVLPAIPRQRLIQYPAMCYDYEMDKFSNPAGYEGGAYARLKTLETIESNGDTLKVEDFRTGETYTGIIEEIDFTNKTPSDKRFSGFGGVMLVTIRTIS